VTQKGSQPVITSSMIDKKGSNIDVLFVKKDNGKPITINLAG
jgi:hypothetical protein